METESYPYGKRYYYPHMKPADVTIWERLIEKYPNLYNYCQYDVPVGQVPDHAKQPLSETGGTAEKLYKRKIDVVAYKADKVSIIEIKPNAGLSAIGQVDGYRSLYTRDYSPSGQLRCIIVTDATDPDTLEVAKQKGVEIIVV